MDRIIELAAGLFGHASRALWWPAIRTALVADVHLGYGWAQRRRGQLGPVEDPDTLPRLVAMMEELRPERVVILGDVVHAPRPAPRERDLVVATVRWLLERTEVDLVLGNHDRGFVTDYPELPLRVCQTWAEGHVLAMHGDRPSAAPRRELAVLGHLHPALGVVDDAGASQRIPVFLSSPRAIVLPAFSPFAAGFDVKKRVPKEVRDVLGPGELDVVAATGKRVVRLGPLSGIRSRVP